MSIDQTGATDGYFGSKPDDRRKTGRPRFIWLEDVENNLRGLKLKKRRQQANSRENCPTVVAAKVLRIQ
jgi:hypothetical protein